MTNKVKVEIIVEREMGLSSFAILIMEFTKIKDELKYISEIEDKITELKKEKKRAKEHINNINRYISQFHSVFVKINNERVLREVENGKT